jgi:hypothetical protein
MMSNYIEQSKNLFVQMQDQMQQQARTMFQTFPFAGSRQEAAPRTRPRNATAAPHGAAFFILSVPGFPLMTAVAKPVRKPRAPRAPRVGTSVSLGCREGHWSIPSGSSPQLRAEGYDVAPSYDGADLVSRQHLRLHRCGGGRVARCDRRGARRERQASSSPAASGAAGRLGRASGHAGASPPCSRSTGPHATEEVMAHVHAHLPKPHDPFVDLVRRRGGIKLTPPAITPYLKISEGCNHRLRVLHHPGRCAATWSSRPHRRCAA